MFTGLVETTGHVAWILKKGEGFELQIDADSIASKVRPGDSVAVNGCCLTVSALRGSKIGFDLLQETLERTNLGKLRPEMSVNLERAVRADGRLGGHFVQGHIDTTASVLEYSEHGSDWKLVVEMPVDFRQYVAFKGSIAINGVSLTVAELFSNAFQCWIIPHTRAETQFKTLQVGDLVNLECDILAKYVERVMLARDQAQQVDHMREQSRNQWSA